MSDYSLNLATANNNGKCTVSKHCYGRLNIRGYHLLSELNVGSFCAVGPNVEIIIKGWSHNTDWFTTYPFESFANKFSNASSIVPYPRVPRVIDIGNDVWLGMNSLIMSDVKIGDGAVVGTRAIVTKDVPAYHIAIGSPARFIPRFDQNTIDILLQLKWWEWTDEKINNHIDIINSNNIDQLKNLL